MSDMIRAMWQRIKDGRAWIGLLMIWGFVSLACNLPAGEIKYVELERPTVQVEVVEGGVDSAETAPDPTPTNIPLPPVTDGSATPTLIPSTGSEALVFAPTVTPRGTPDATVEPPTPTPVPLELSHLIEWRLNANDTNFSFAKVTLTATGGEPPYVFYRDGLAAGGANFSYRWGSCQANPGTFKVESADGQSVEVEYLEETPCPQG